MLPMPQVLILLDRFESRLTSFIQDEGRHLFQAELLIDTTSEEANAIIYELESSHSLKSVHQNSSVES